MFTSAITSLSAIAVLLWAPAPVLAEASEASDVGDPDSVVTFIANEDATFDSIYDSLLDSNDASVVADFLGAQATADQPLTDDLGLSGMSDADAREVLSEAAEAADESSDASTTSFSKERPPVIQLASARQHLNTQHPRLAGLMKMSVSSAPVKGQATNNGFSWTYSARAYLWECTWFSCTARSWLDYRLVTDPGKSRTRTNLQFTRGGEGRLTAVDLETVVLSAGRNIDDVSYRWNAPVSGLYQWNGPHASTKGATFQMYYRLTFSAAGSASSSFEYKSGRSRMCAEPFPGAYRCQF